ncbi:MAG: polyprenyl synthetase family protein [Hyphomicrobiaceae bacterium]|nr:polyprenyl synthetase family protein [Hyphomicrobiaceae bacterium]MCC0023671.1 polyprenyl synthetase family protein [Hyphomicrobiaceae bacterium]
MPQPQDFATRLENFATRFGDALDRELRAEKLSGPGRAPDRLIEAMRHGALNGGKRLRPFLLVETARLFDAGEPETLPAALAVEFIHCYSLVHDDLPAMDDDDTRRGQPTVHKAYDEATAILAGDALLTHAFGLLASETCHPDPAIRAALVTELVAGSGAGGMAGGQMRDLEGEKGGFSTDDITEMQQMKTGALIRSAVRMGALLGGASPDQFKALTLFGEEAGRAFQLADDILDLTASSEAMGKATGKDHARQKPTLVSRIGLNAAYSHLGDRIHHAISALMMFGPEADTLRETARYFAERQK